MCLTPAWTLMGPWWWTGMSGENISCSTQPRTCRRSYATGNTPRWTDTHTFFRQTETCLQRDQPRATFPVCMDTMNFLFSAVCVSAAVLNIWNISPLGQSGNPFPSNSNADKHVTNWFDICFEHFSCLDLEQQWIESLSENHQTCLSETGRAADNSSVSWAIKI